MQVTLGIPSDVPYRYNFCYCVQFHVVIPNYKVKSVSLILSQAVFSLLLYHLSYQAVRLGGTN